MTFEQTVTITELMGQYQLLGISGEDPVVLDLGDDTTVEIRANGTQLWLLNEQQHRTDGPAEIEANGSQRWWLNGKRHRTDGPAVIRADGSQYWFLNGKEMTQKKHSRRTASERM